jgi:hypothetical protein
MNRMGSTMLSMEGGWLGDLSCATFWAVLVGFCFHTNRLFDFVGFIGRLCGTTFFIYLASNWSKVGPTLLSRPDVLAVFCFLTLVLERCGPMVWGCFFWPSADCPGIIAGLSAPVSDCTTLVPGPSNVRKTGDRDRVPDRACPPSVHPTLWMGT